MTATKMSRPLDRALHDELPAHAEGLRRYALAMTRNAADADDLVQECFKRALSYARSGREIDNLRAYLFTILTNVHRDELARRRRRGTSVPIENELNNIACAPRQTARLEWSDLARALDAIPDQQKQVVLLIGLLGESYERAAEMLNIPMGTVMSRLSRGRSALREAMAG
jgi:RNA polymerase sigma-70 factor, ECF subfamily